jgi:hypothetical protein
MCISRCLSQIFDLYRIFERNFSVPVFFSFMLSIPPFVHFCFPAYAPFIVTYFKISAVKRTLKWSCHVRHPRPDTHRFCNSFSDGNHFRSLPIRKARVFDQKTAAVYALNPFSRDLRSRKRNNLKVLLADGFKSSFFMFSLFCHLSLCSVRRNGCSW